MIRYAIPYRELRRQVDAHKDTWLDRAEERREKFIAIGRYEESSSIWSEIKPVFMEIQFNKCVFCERVLAGERFGRVEHDLEHFRPKGRVKNWPSRSSGLSFDFELGDPDPNGYYWLAYDLRNYATACKTCNSSLKSAAFPIAGPRGVVPEGFVALRNREKPYLCYPIGNGDVDPETLIDFVGTVARPAGSRGYKRQRAEVMIEFFKLNERDELHLERSNEIAAIGYLLEKIEAGTDVPRHETWLEGTLADNQPHAACKRSFRRHWDDDRAFAKRLLDEARELIYTRNIPDA